jgi:excisionase family DNA binding protein
VSGAGHLLTAGELAERWRVPKGHVYRLTRDGLIPAVRLGRYYRYRLEAIERWEAESEQMAGDRARAA